MRLLLNIMDLPLVEILGMGTIGLGFLLAFLSFRMLTREQSRDEVRKGMLISIYIFMGFSLILCIFGVVSQPVLGSDKNTDGENIDTNQYLAEITALKSELSECQVAGEEQILPSNLALLTSDYFTAEDTRDSVLQKIRDLVKMEREQEKNRKHYAYTLFLLEKTMHGQNVNLRLPDEGYPEVNKHIQLALRGLERYKGPIDGDRATTYEAVVKFQQWLNTVSPNSPYIAPKNYGIFGFSTLNAIRDQYRMRGEEG